MSKDESELDGWLLRESPDGARSASNGDGTGFSCSRELGMAATTTQVSVLPPKILAWLIEPLLRGYVRTDDLDDMFRALGWP